MRSKLLAAVLACSAVFGLASCGAMLPESSSETETTTGTAAQRVIETTKTATMGDDYDEDDEDYEGYTTTTSVTAGTLENPDVSIDEGYDPDIIATATKRTTTSRCVYSHPAVHPVMTAEAQRPPPQPQHLPKQRRLKRPPPQSSKRTHFSLWAMM